MVVLECVSCSKEDLGNVIKQLQTTEELSVEKGIIFILCSSGGHTRISRQMFFSLTGSRFLRV